MWKYIATLLITIELARLLINYVVYLERGFRRDPDDAYDMGGDWRDDDD